MAWRKTTHGTNLLGERDIDSKRAYRGYLITKNGTHYWIEKDGIVVYRSATSMEDAERTIREDLAG